MKAGTPVPGLDFYKNVETIVSKERSEYPEWVNDLSRDKISLTALQKMDNEDATLEDMKRYIKLSRRVKIKESNSGSK